MFYSYEAVIKCDFSFLNCSKLYNIQIRVGSRFDLAQCINHWDLWPCSDTKHFSLSMCLFCSRASLYSPTSFIHI